MNPKYYHVAWGEFQDRAVIKDTKGNAYMWMIRDDGNPGEEPECEMILRRIKLEVEE